MLRLFRRYLTWIQNSVFEGELTHSQFKSLQIDIEKLIQDTDEVVFYQLRDERYLDRIALGEEKAERTRFL